MSPFSKRSESLATWERHWLVFCGMESEQVERLPRATINELCGNLFAYGPNGDTIDRFLTWVEQLENFSKNRLAFALEDNTLTPPKDLVLAVESSDITDGGLTWNTRQLFVDCIGERIADAVPFVLYEQEKALRACAYTMLGDKVLNCLASSELEELRVDGSFSEAFTDYRTQLKLAGFEA